MMMKVMMMELISQVHRCTVRRQIVVHSRCTDELSSSPAPEVELVRGVRQLLTTSLRLNPMPDISTTIKSLKGPDLAGGGPGAQLTLGH